MQYQLFLCRKPRQPVHHKIPLGRVQAACVADGHCWHPLQQPAAFTNPYGEQVNTLLQSYGLSAAQKTSCLLDHTGWFEQSSVLMDQLIAFKSDSLDGVINAMFFRKMPRYIRDVVNPKDYKKLYDLT